MPIEASGKSAVELMFTAYRNYRISDFFINIVVPPYLCVIPKLVYIY